MPSNYSGTPANVVGTRLVIPEPVDADPRNAASVNTCLSPLADFTELLLEQLLAACTSNWTKQTGVSTAATAIATDGSFNAGGGTSVHYVVVGGSGNAESSPDAKTWTSRTSNTTSNLKGVTFGNSLWVAVGGTGAASSGTVITSPDGITWTQRTNTLATTNLWTVVWSADVSLFIAAGESGALFSSPDGTTWTSRTSGLAGTIKASAAGGGLVVVGQTTGTTNNLATSTNGTSWTVRTLGNNDAMNTCIYANGLFVAGASTSAIVYTSPDGITWTNRVTNGSSSISVGGIAWNGRQFLCNNNGSLKASIDGKTWSATRPNDEWGGGGNEKPVAGNSSSGLFVGVGTTSTDRFVSLKHPAG